jgi:hypothetical protein
MVSNSQAALNGIQLSSCTLWSPAYKLRLMVSHSQAALTAEAAKIASFNGQDHELSKQKNPARRM